MQKRNAILTICTLFLVVFFTGCESEDEGKKASMSGKVDGQALNFQDVSARIFTDDDFRSLNINGTINGKDLFISVVGWDFKGHPENGVLVQKYYTSENKSCDEDEHGVTKCESGTVDYTIVTATTQEEYSAGLVQGYEGYVEITSFNSNKKKVSGKFQAKVSNWDGESMIVEGEFHDLPYVVLD